MGKDDYSNLCCQLICKQLPGWLEEHCEETLGELTSICMQIQNSNVGVGRLARVGGDVTLTYDPSGVLDKTQHWKTKNGMCYIKIITNKSNRIF